VGCSIEISTDTTIAARNAAITAPTADEMLIQARTAGAQAFVVVEVVNRIGTARLVGVDGRERDRRTMSVTTTLAPLAAAVRDLLAPPLIARTRWYQSKWVWAAGAAVIAAAILVPITATAASDNAATTFTSKFQGVPTSWR